MVEEDVTTPEDFAVGNLMKMWMIQVMLNRALIIVVNNELGLSDGQIWPLTKKSSWPKFQPVWVGILTVYCIVLMPIV